MSATIVNRALEHMGYPTGSVTGHGFRATASTRLHEMGFRPELIERQLAHTERNQVKAAYNHAESIDEHRAIMNCWNDWIGSIESVPFVLLLPEKHAFTVVISKIDEYLNAATRENTRHNIRFQFR